MAHKIYLTHDKGAGNREAYKLIKNAIKAALKAEGVTESCEVSVYVTGNNEIHRLNREYRNVDRPTDVLSFPMQSFIPGDFDAAEADADPESGRIPLGDVVISYEKAAEQALEFGHSPERETAYLTVHSILHLLGYDHVDEGSEKKQMRAREKEIMKIMGLSETQDL